jgi:hypothetical protein
VQVQIEPVLKVIGVFLVDSETAEDEDRATSMRPRLVKEQEIHEGPEGTPDAKVPRPRWGRGALSQSNLGVAPEPVSTARQSNQGSRNRQAVLGADLKIPIGGTTVNLNRH